MTDPRIHEYETRHACLLHGFLGPGPGQDGFVIQSNRLSAVKFFDRPERFEREAEVYQLLQARGIRDIAGHAAPRLISVDSALHAIEMTIVERPFVLDFAGAKRPEEVPDFPDEVLDEYYERLKELFGDHWSDAIHVADMFQLATGFTLLDIHPGNIAFADPE